jgi:hypothetical protein
MAGVSAFPSAGPLSSGWKDLGARNVEDTNQRSDPLAKVLHFLQRIIPTGDRGKQIGCILMIQARQGDGHIAGAGAMPGDPLIIEILD